MDAIEQLKQDVREGRVGVDRLIDVIVTQQRQLESALQELKAARQRIEELEKKVGGSGTAKVDEPFSMRAEEKRQQARHKKKKHKLLGIVLVFDEIVTGFRLAWGGAQERYGVAADLACYGKVIGGGYPLSVVVGKRELLQLADPQQKGRGPYCFLSGTLTANPIACAAGLATLNVLRQPALCRLRSEAEKLIRLDPAAQSKMD